MEDAVIQIHVYQLSDNDVFEEFSNSSGNRNEDDGTMAASVCELPNRSYEGLWDSLIYTGNIKMNLLDYIHATLVLSDANVDCESTIIPCHDQVLFQKSIWCHGIVLSCFMDLLAQERHRYAVLWPKSWLFDFLTGQSSSSMLDFEHTKHKIQVHTSSASRDTFALTLL